MDRFRLKRFIDQRTADLPLDRPVFVSQDTPIREALALMQRGSLSCVLVGDEMHVTGIFTERDVLRKCMDRGFDWAQPLGGGVLTPDPSVMSGQQTVAEAIALMQQGNYRTMPVMEGGRVIGLVRLGDLLTHLAEAFPEDVLNLPPRPHQVMGKQEGG